MPSVLFWKCADCGIEWRALMNSDGEKSVYACHCGRQQDVPSTIVGLYYLPLDGGGTRVADWKEIPPEKLRLSTDGDRPDKA
jgi:hypothetical protein